MTGTAWQSFMTFMQDPPVWAALLIVMVGAFILNYGRDLWVVVVAGMLGAFAWFALGTLVASFAMGWPYILAWILVALILLYNMGWLIEKERYFMLTVNLVIVVALASIISSNLFQLSFWKSVGVGLVTLCVHLFIGFFVAMLKWWSFNRKRLDVGKDSRAAFLVELRQKYDRFLHLRANPRMTRGGMAQITDPSDEFTDAEGTAILAFPTEQRALRNMPVPAVLIERYDRHLQYARAQVPTPYDMKDKFLWWMIAWPAILVHMTLADLMEHLWRWFFEMIDAVLVSIQRSVFRGNEEFLKK
ncbi:MAG: hypothetical protein AAB421_05215 [Patescibacteria group bacterium]